MEEYKRDLRVDVTAYTKSLDVPDFIHHFNEMVNRQLWEHAAQEEKSVVLRILQMWHVVQAVAALEGDVYIYSDNQGNSACLFCGDVIGYAPGQKQKPQHAPDCAYMIAKRLVESEKA